MSYDQIVAAALERDINALKKALKKTAIDVWNPRKVYYSAVSHCALQNDTMAVDFLLDKGASLDYAALGAARGGHYEYCDKLIEKGASLNHAALGAALGGHERYCQRLIERGANPAFAVLGAALSNNRSHCDNLIESGASLDYAALGAAAFSAFGIFMDESNSEEFTYYQVLLKQGASLNYIAMGAALGGAYAYCKELLRDNPACADYIAWGAGLRGDYSYCDELIAQGVNINSIMIGAAQGGHSAYCAKLLKQGASLRYAVEGAALGGHYDYCKTLITQGTKRNATYRNALLNYALLGAVRGGFFEYCNKLIQWGALPEYAVMGAAQSGYFEKCNQLIESASPEQLYLFLTSAIEGAARGGQHHYRDELISRGMKDHSFSRAHLIKFAVFGAALSGDYEYLNGHINDYSNDYSNERLNAPLEDLTLGQLAALGAAFHGDYAYLRVILERYSLALRPITAKMFTYHLFNTKEAVFYYLARMDDDGLRRYFFETMQCQDWGNQARNRIKDHDLEKMQYKIDHIFKYKPEYDLSPYQARVMWENLSKKDVPLLSLWILQIMPELLRGTTTADGNPERPALSSDILLHITRYLFPALTTNSFEALSFKVIRHFLILAIDHYIPVPSRSSILFSLLRSIQPPPPESLPIIEQAKNFKETIITAESKHEFATLCKKEYTFFREINSTEDPEKQNPFEVALERACARLG